MAKYYDFSGWATKNDLKCSDGRTIRRNAFKDNDGSTVPLVWNHQHNDPMNVLGHALLENRDEGVYAYCTFNDTPAGANARTLVSHGDVVALSIYANRLQQKGADVLHGAIREVSLVLAGANPGALIDSVIEHGEESEDSAIIYTGEEIYLSHADDSEPTLDDVYSNMTDEQKDAINTVIALYIANAEGGIEPDDIQRAIEQTTEDDETIEDIFDAMTDEEYNTAMAIIGASVEAYENGEIEDDDLEHSDENDEEEEDDNMTIEDIYDSMTNEQQDAIDAVVAMYISDSEGEIDHADESDFFIHADGDDISVDDVFDTMTDEQYDAAMEIIDAAINSYETGEVDDILDDEDSDEDDDEDDEDDEDSDEDIDTNIDTDVEGDAEMAHNIFENDEYIGNILSHADEESIFTSAAQQFGSLRKAVQNYSMETGNELVLRHDDDDDTPTYGINNINYLFPDAHLVTDTPVFIKRSTDWVTKFMNGAKHIPFARLKSIFADITADDARAKGYVTGARKAEEVFNLLNRTTDPTTIYKKQKLDRDNVVDVNNFQIVAWLKSEMDLMLKEEIARAALLGDGRAMGPDKINEACVRPVWTDDDLFTIKYRMEIPSDATEDIIAKNIIRGAVKSRKTYRGSGNPIMFTTEEYLTDMLLMEDLNGHAIYENEASLARAVRCSEIVTVPVMENRTRTVTLDGGGTETRKLYAVIVNPDDYTFGADKGGAINMFDDFDIDYNQMVYLMETRCSGSLLLPYSAIALEGVTV